ncbi:hypothetical protein LCGC14_0410970 [marine sediment metagenome]|uniref:Uncharacterized protein n=1 Tax=marine sediment metagenome TaxID=412755 RepID=A0A0F9VFP6_9ZZZZ
MSSAAACSIESIMISLRCPTMGLSIVVLIVYTLVGDVQMGRQKNFALDMGACVCYALRDGRDRGACAV